MATIVATTFTGNDYVRLDVDWTASPEVQYARVIRINLATGEEVVLRPYVGYDGDGNLLLECGLGVWWDTEPPLGVSLQYRTEAADVLTALSANTGFETGTAPWVATGGVLTQSATFAHAGTFSGLLTPTGGVAASFTQTLVAGILGGLELTMQAWVLSPQGWNGVRLQMALLYTDGTVETVNSFTEILDDGEWRFLRWKMIPRLNATATTFDFRVLGLPPNTTLFYVDEIGIYQPAAVATTALSNIVSLLADAIWLKNPLHPCLDVAISLCDPAYDPCTEDDRVSYVGTETHEYDPNTALLYPVNRRRPIPVNRVRRDARTVLRLLAHDCAARDMILAANEPGDPLLFQAPAEYCIEDRYVSVGTVSETKISIDQREPFRLMTLPYVIVDRPEGPADGPCGIRITDLCDIYSSWAAITIAGLTYTDLLLGEASHSSPGNALPAAARTWGEVETEFATWLAVEAGGTRDWGELRDGL